MKRPVINQHLRNLVIVHTPRSQALSDWVAVKEKINAKAPDIEVRIADNRSIDPGIREWQVTRPSLVFSPCNLLGFRPAGGKIYVGRNLDKLEEMRRLHRAGVPVPHSVLLIPGLSLDSNAWGEYVLVKPLAEGGSYGKSIKLARSDTVGARHLELTLNGRIRMLVQRLIDATDEHGRIFAYRVLTVFGHPLYLRKSTQATPRPPLAEICDQGSSVIAHNLDGVVRERELAWDSDVLELARRAASAISEFPCLGLDIIREKSTGNLFVLETNSGGNVWHLSSTVSIEPKQRRQMYNQFGALDVVADALIEKTRREASWFLV
jgi:hypothetical protein